MSSGAFELRAIEGHRRAQICAIETRYSAEYVNVQQVLDDLEITESQMQNNLVASQPKVKLAPRRI